MDRKETFGELIRFGIVGTTAAAIHYAVYWILQHWIEVNIAYTIGYIVSFFVNYYLSAHFTFKAKTSARNGIGFGGAHLFNYLLHMVLFNVFLWLGLSRELAPIAVLAIAVPTNFIIVRLVFKKLSPHTLSIIHHPSSIVIGFDAKRIVKNATGLGSYSRTLINDLARQNITLRLYAPDKGRDDLREQIVKQDNVSFCYPHASSHRQSRFFTLHSSLFTSYWRSRGIVRDLLHDGVQLYHGLSGELPIGLRKSGIKSVVTIHDLIFLRHPEYYHWLDTKIYAWKFRRTLREADHIIAISECTKRDIIEYGHVDPSRISVIYQSYAPRFGVANSTLYPLHSKYILSVGSIEARKNILLAIKALPLLPEDLSLVIVGRHTKYTDLVTDYIKTHQLEHRVKILHGVTDDELPALYAGAEAFVYPSRYEGFGIPIIEAISSGLPVVACTGSCLEEAGGPDSLYVDPDDVEGMSAAIRQCLKGAEGRNERISRSREYIRRFEGSDVASQVISLYQRLLKNAQTSEDY